MRCPPIRFRRPVSSCPAVWCAARPVSSPVRCPVTWVRRPGSGGPAVRCPPVQRPAVWCPPVQRPALRCPPPSVRTRPSPPTSGGGVGDQMGRRGNLHHGNGSRSRGGRAVERLGQRAEAWMTRATLLGSRVGRWVSAADPAGLGEGGGGRACPLPDQAGQAGVRSARGWRLRCGHGAGGSARLPHRWRGCRPGLCATTVRGCRGA